MSHWQSKINDYVAKAPEEYLKYLTLAKREPFAMMRLAPIAKRIEMAIQAGGIENDSYSSFVQFEDSFDEWYKTLGYYKYECQQEKRRKLATERFGTKFKEDI